MVEILLNRFDHPQETLLVSESVTVEYSWNVRTLTGSFFWNLRIGFSKVLVQQDAICTSFATGLSMACVVDIGHVTTSITCVEECAVLQPSIVTVPSGSALVTCLMNHFTGRVTDDLG